MHVEVSLKSPTTNTHTQREREREGERERVRKIKMGKTELERWKGRKSEGDRVEEIYSRGRLHNTSFTKHCCQYVFYTP